MKDTEQFIPSHSFIHPFKDKSNSYLASWLQKWLLNIFKHFFHTFSGAHLTPFCPEYRQNITFENQILKNEPRKKKYEKKISFSNYNKSIKKFSHFLLRSWDGGRRHPVLCVRERGVGLWVSGFYVLERPRLSRSLTCGGKAGDHQWKLRWFERTTMVKDVQVSSSLPCISWRASAL